MRGIAATLVFHMVYAAWLLVHPVSRHFTQLGDDVLQTLGAALATGFCFLRFPGTETLPRRTRRSAWFCGLGICNYTLEQCFLSYPDFLHHPLPLPSVLVDIVSLASYPLLLLGIWLLPRRPLALSSQIRISLDAMMVMVSAVTFSWYFVLGPTLLTTHLPLKSRIIAVGYLLMDLLLVACVLLLGVRTTHRRSVLVLFTSGLLITVVADTFFSYLSLRGIFQSGTLIDICWSFGFMLIGVGVYTSQQPAPLAATTRDRLPPLWKSLLPYALLPAVAVLVLYTEQKAGPAILRHGVFWGALALISLVIGRQVLALLENRELNRRTEALATTDPLTGLCNHRTFHLRLLEEAARAERDNQVFVVAMLDLDNFKFFNDAYGHAAGDDVLRRVTRALLENTLPGDTVGRFGGDEFALILPLNTVGVLHQGMSSRGVQESLEASLAALFFLPPGGSSEIPLTISLGVAVFPGEAASPLEALELADRRLMYAKTGGGSDNPADTLYHDLALSLSGFPMLNALVTAVDNKDRYTRRHSEDVLTYSLQIADCLHLNTETRRTLQIAALLHDVGKIGVPDRVLRKPGALTDEEYQSVQQHPAMGAAIVGAVPGFEGTLETIRHHHERWDGGGYPDGLSGTETPFLARLVAVADAFSAMTTDRPYRKGMERGKALRILEEGAGTQWDPECVEALLRCYSRQEAPPQRLALAA